MDGHEKIMDRDLEALNKIAREDEPTADPFPALVSLLLIAALATFATLGIWLSG